MKTKNYNPDPLASWKEKKTDAYGLPYAQIIAKDWFDGGMITDDCQYGIRRDWIRNKRKLARGEQDTKKAKDHISRQEGDLSYLNLDWTPINIAGKFTKVVSNGIKDDYYNLDIRANDRFTLLNKKKKLDEHRNNMRSMPLLKKVKEQLGLDLIPKGFVPQDEDELKLYSEIQDRPKIEIAEEITIDYVKNTNDYDNTELVKNKNLTEIGIAGARIWTDPVNGVQSDEIDPEYLVHSFVRKNNFKDAYYFGHIRDITIDDIKRDSNFDDATLRKIAAHWAGSNKRSENYNQCDIRDLLDYRVSVMDFTFKTTKTTVYKAHKKEGAVVKVTTKDESYNPPERNDYGKIEDTKDTWMEGTYILDSEYIYNYKECENIIRDERNKAVSPFVVIATDIYENQLHSFLDDIEPIERSMQFTHLKIQHLRAELKPDLVEIDIDSLAELPNKGAKKENWKEALNIMNVKGVIFTKRVDLGEMGIKDGQGVKPRATSQGSGLAVLLNLWAHDYNTIRDITGVNPARDGSLPHDALLGVNQMAQLASNTATQHIVDASIAFNKRYCEVVSSRIHNIFKSKAEGAKRLKDMYERAVGKENLEALEVMGDRHLHDFGFTVNMVPTKQEMTDFKEDLGISLQDGSIDVEIKSEAQRIAKINMKLAHQYLFYMRKKRRKELMEEEAKMSKIKSQNDIQSSTAASKNQVQAYAMKTEMDLKKEQKMAQIRVFEKQAMQQIEQPRKEQEFKQEVFLKQMDNSGGFDKAKYMEDRKDQRTKIQATQQARMIPERKSDNPKAIDFENEDIFAHIFGT